MYKENDIFYEDKEYAQRADWCNESGKYHIQEIEPDENGRRFKIVKNPEPTAEELAEQQKQARIEEIKTELTNLSQDFIQAEIGAVFDDLEQRKELFKALHNELRALLGKEPRQYE